MSTTDDRWLALIGGRDSAVLAAAGHRVVGIDRSDSAIATARARVPSAEFHCQDVGAAFPVERANHVGQPDADP